MAKKIQRKTSKQTKKNSVSPFNIYWNKKNYVFLIAGFVVMILGYWIMSTGNWDSTGALVISPIVLTITYVIIFPLSIFSKQKAEQQNSEINPK
jgi:ATP/ADP translocase